MSTARMLSRAALSAVAICFFSAGAQAQQATEIQLSYKDKKFTPPEISAPANTAIVIKLKNLDAKAMEFESKTLRVEKVIAGNGEATIRLRPLECGRYKFFGEFNEATAQGVLVAE